MGNFFTIMEEEENLETKYANILEFVDNNRIGLESNKSILQSEISQLLEVYLTQKESYQKLKDEFNKEKQRLQKEIDNLRNNQWYQSEGLLKNDFVQSSKLSEPSKIIDKILQELESPETDSVKKAERVKFSIL